MTDKKNYKELENLKAKGTKKYQQRLIEEKEAEDMIRNLELDEDGYVVEPNKLILDKDGV